MTIFLKYTENTMRTNNRIERDKERTNARIARCNADILRQSANALRAEVEKLKALPECAENKDEIKRRDAFTVIGLVASSLCEEAQNFDDDARQCSARANEWVRVIAAEKRKARGQG